MSGASKNIFIYLQLILLGTLVSLVALILAVAVVGPMVRTLIGAPPGFGSDFTSLEAYIQAGAVQCVSLSFLFFLFGLSARPRVVKSKWQRALGSANPLSVGLGYFLLRLISADIWPYEYTSYRNWMLLALLAPFILAPLVYLGILLNRRPS